MNWFITAGWIIFALNILGLIINIFMSKYDSWIVGLNAIIGTGILVWIYYAIQLAR
jgi:hypothetical protein